MLKAINKYTDQQLFYAFGFFLILSSLFAVLLYNPIPLLFPVAMAFGLMVLTKPILLYYLFFFLLPFSVEIYLPNGLGTDLPSEPLMLVLTGVTLLLALTNVYKIKAAYFNHSITLILLLHVFWIVLTMLFSTNMTFSIKYLLAKIWYVLPFYFLPFFLLKSEKQFRNIFKWLAVGLFISIIYVLINHAGMSFSFDSVNKAVKPIYRNHVNYGVILVAFLPMMWYLYATSKSYKWLKLCALVLLILAIYLTYTRAAQVCIVLAVGIYWVIKLRLAKVAILFALAIGFLLVIYLSVNNRYLDMAPDYNKAIAHKKFDNLVEATYKMEDISTVERFYRWVAGFYMVKERPLLGFGPATFYSEYKSYTVTSYKTYVSDNPEKSGIHNYYLMIAVEQGIPGLIIFLCLAIWPIIKGEELFHSLQDTDTKQLVMAAIIGFVLIDIVIIINDLIEADKVGPFYFLYMSIIVYFTVNKERKNKDKNLA